MPNWSPCPNCEDCDLVNIGERCPVCGKPNHGDLKITSSMGKSIEFKTTSRVGNSILKDLDPEDSRYASGVQFVIRKCSNPNWLICIENQPKHRTFVNSHPLEIGTDIQLTPGDEISIEDKVLRLKVDVI